MFTLTLLFKNVHDFTFTLKQTLSLTIIVLQALVSLIQGESISPGQSTTVSYKTLA